MGAINNNITAMNPNLNLGAIGMDIYGMNSSYNGYAVNPNLPFLSINSNLNFPLMNPQATGYGINPYNNPVMNGNLVVNGGFSTM